MNNKTKTFSMFLLAAILVAGTISMAIPKSFAQGFNDNLGSDDFVVSFPNDHKKQGSSVNIQKAKCNNIIINGVDKSHPMPGEMPTAMAAADENNGIGQQSQGFNNGEKKFKGFDKNIVNHCINKHNILAVAEQNGLNVGSLYIVEGPVVENQPGNPTESIASCDDGDFVISGGFNFIPGGIGGIYDFDFIQSNPTSTLDGWSAGFFTDAGTTTIQIQATAVCFDAQ